MSKPPTYSQSQFPEKWVCEDAAMRVELLLPQSFEEFEGNDTPLNTFDALGDDDRQFRVSDYTWVEIPTTKVELYEDKGEAAAIQRTAKVQFPTVWGDASPRDLIQRYSQDMYRPLVFARISVEGTYKHLGWVGGVGHSGDVGVSKMWVYDFAEMWGGEDVSHAFKNPTVRDVVKEIADMTADSTDAPIVASVVRPAKTKEEIETLVRAEIQFLPEDVTVAGPPKDISREFPTATLDDKTFKSNRATILDVVNWLQETTLSSLYFEPVPSGNGLILVCDVEPNRELYGQDAIVESVPPGFKRRLRDKYDGFVEVRSNDALYEMKPYNTIVVEGKTRGGIFAESVQRLIDDVDTLWGDNDPPTDKYPKATVQIPSLVEAAGGRTVNPRIIEAKTTDLDKTIEKAKEELRRLLSEQSEGTIEVTGERGLEPYDALVAHEACSSRFGTFVDFTDDPIKYEVESVQHTASAESTYTSKVNVSIWANEENMEVVDDETEYEKV